MNASTELKQQVVDLQSTIEKIKSQQSDAGSIDTIAAIKKGDLQFAQARKNFYQLQREMMIPILFAFTQFLAD